LQLPWPICGYAVGEAAECINVTRQDLAPFRSGLGGAGIKGRSHFGLPGSHTEMPMADSG
jgi:hypothetical protein